MLSALFLYDFLAAGIEQKGRTHARPETSNV